MADGVCEECGKEAPFLKESDGKPYLEVHHVTPLSMGGADTIDNTIAVCPNCHRQYHHGPLFQTDL
ncbi:HNH endonuclease [Tardiphaga robiniae]|uniref:HNH endonuclease n=1 Tax=Tardiphaga robiniae TaxID=943830 RepID=UPI0035B52421